VILGHSGIFETNTIPDKLNAKSDEIKTPEKMKKSIVETVKKTQGSDIFKLKLKSSTVFYDEIE